MSDEKRLEQEKEEINTAEETTVSEQTKEEEPMASNQLDMPAGDASQRNDNRPKQSRGTGWIVGSILVAAAAIIIVLLAAKPFGGGSEVAASVNGVDITKEQLLQELLEQDQGGTLDRLIEEELVRQDAESQGVEVTDEDVNDEYNFIKGTFSSDVEFDYLMQYSGLTEASFKEQIKDQLLITKTLEKEIEITDDEIQTKFDEYKASYADPERIRASHILVEDRATAEELLEQINNGEDFAKLAQENSIDGSAATGGNLDYFTKEDMVEPFSNAAFALKKGEVSDVVETEYGFHIIKVTDVPKDWTLEEKEDEIRRMILSEKVSQQFSSWLEELKNNADIKNYMEEEAPVDLEETTSE